MRVAFVAPELRRLDTVRSNAICLCLARNDWPLRGAPGLVDWRVSGHLSRLAQSGWLTCDRDEVVLMPLAGRLPFDKLLVVGVGAGLEDGEIEAGLHRMFETLGKMRVHAAVVHLPGRTRGLGPERAMELLLEVSRSHPDHDEVVLVEPLEAQRAMKAVLDARRGAGRD